MSALSETVAGMVPRVHDALRSGDDMRGVVWEPALDRYNVSPDEDLSRSAWCYRLTHALLGMLQEEDLPARRELHRHPYSNQWHMVISHSLGEPTKDDIITDLNPWTYAATKDPLPDHLHGPRREVVKAVRASGSHTVRAECLLVATIAAPHVAELQPDIDSLPGSQLILDRGEKGFDFGFPDWRKGEQVWRITL